MKRTLDITVDLKVQEYTPIKLKQIDTTQLNITVLDNTVEVDLTGMSANLIVGRENNTTVIQSSGISIEDNKVQIVLIDDCLRVKGKTTLEIELKKDNETVSTFCIPAIVEKTAKDNIQSTNTPNYWETLENAAEEEAKRVQAEESRAEAETARAEAETERAEAEDERIDAESERTEAETARAEAETDREAAETERENAETSRVSAEKARAQAETQRAKDFEEIKNNAFVINIQDIADLKAKTQEIEMYTYNLILDENVAAGGEIVLPFYYKVGANVLQVYYVGNLLLLSSDDAGSNGHYREVGTAGSLSNKIKLTTDWSAEQGGYFNFVVKGVYENETV